MSTDLEKFENMTEWQVVVIMLQVLGTLIAVAGLTLAAVVVFRQL